MSASTRTSELASLSSATDWINSPPLTAEGLRGKAVLVQFWTYSCVNWIRTLPYRYRHFGEGAYVESERAIQELLAEGGARGVGRELVSVAPRGAEAAADWANVKTPET